MKEILFIGLVSLSFVLNGQKLPASSINFIKETLFKADVEKVEFNDYRSFNFGNLWLQHQDAVIGYIGNDYQRIHIYFTSIIQDKEKENEYFVYGKSKVQSNVCEFQGKFIITHVLKYKKSKQEALYKEAVKQNDFDAINRYGKKKGFVLVECYLLENPEQKGSGLFNGVLKSYFYVENGEILFDDLNLEFEDDYYNNLFVGTWEGYKTGVRKPCNWGAYRIPNAHDLDVGVGEFSPNVKYLNKGWDTYYRAYNKSDSEARRVEEFKWWKE